MRLLLSCVSLVFLLLQITALETDDDDVPRQLSYMRGDIIPVECLNRSIDTGEHILDKAGNLQYVPFAVCNETQSPLQLHFLEGEDAGLNCTIAAVSDEMYHLFEFYIHHDSPMSCRVRARPAGDGELLPSDGDSGSGGVEWVPLVIALAGKLESSHLHVSTNLNMLLHISSSSSSSAIDSAAAYSTSLDESSTARIVIGDPLPLRFRVRWYATSDLPPGEATKAASGPAAGHTILYCLLSALVGAAACYAWVVGIDAPRRLRHAKSAGANGGIIGSFAAAAGDKARSGYAGYGFSPKGGGGAGYGGYGAKRKD